MTVAAAMPGSQGARGTQGMAWPLSLALFVAAVFVSIFVYGETWGSMFEIWTSIDTYNYGIFVPLISLWLVIRVRHRVFQHVPTASWWGVLATIIAALLWSIGDLTGLLAINQLAVLALVPSIALAFFGTVVMRSAAFPFLFLLLALPVGEFMIPALITWTADFAVSALEWFGVPVYRDGPYIRIPAGDFQVVKACSGIRYLLTSIVLGALFAYLSYRSPWRRAAFILLCIVAPIIANWLRATCIILIAHLSDMRLAAGVDHFIYGWVFFGLVMLIIFLIGNRFRDGNSSLDVETAATKTAAAPSGSRTGLLIVFAAILVAAPLGKLLADFVAERAAEGVTTRATLLLPSGSKEWRRDRIAAEFWKPVFVGASAFRRADYRDTNGNGGVVAAYAAYYAVQREGEELINVRNSLYQQETWWRRFVSMHQVSANDNALSQRLIETSISDGSKNRLIWHWYNIAGKDVTGVLEAKFATLGGVLTGSGNSAWTFAVATDYSDDIETARQTLDAFVRANLQDIRRCLDMPEREGSGCE